MTVKMIRKQVYIEPRQEKVLKEKSKGWQMSEAEVIRHAIDQLEQAPPPREVRMRAWAKLKAFADERGRMKVTPEPRSWTRDELYEDRLAKWGPDLYDLAGNPIPPHPDAPKE